jgi:solute carrier family 9 (sodium/hydrogen exchanger), member 3
VIGVFLGLMLYIAGQTDYHLDARTFFLVLLPPIILEAGYFMPIRAFFDNIGTILLFAVVGTIWNAVAIGFSLWGFGRLGLYQVFPAMHALVFASVMAAVDPVAVLAVFEEIHVKELLHIIVLGESLLNDGVAVVSFVS